MTDTVTPPSHDLMHVGYHRGRPIFRPIDGSEPPSPHMQLKYLHHNSLGAPEFAVPPKPLKPATGYKLPRWERTEFGFTHQQTSDQWPLEHWKPLCDRARQVREYFDKHRSDPGFPARKAWNETTDRLCTADDPKGMGSPAPRSSADADFIAQCAAEAAARTTPIHAALPHELTSSDFSSGQPQPRIKAPMFKPTRG